MFTASSLKVLLLTSYFPPIGGAGVFRWYNFIKYLYGKVDFTVLTRKPEAGEVIDESLKYVENFAEVLRIPSVSPGAIYKLLKNRGSSSSVSSLPAGGNVEFLQRLFQVPDQRIFELPLLLLKGRKILSKDFDIIIASAPHYSYLLAGSLLKMLKPGVKFVIDLRDPWTPDPLFPFLNAAYRNLNIFLENFVLKNADSIVVVNDGMKDLYIGSFPEFSEKLEVIYNGFNPSDFKKGRNIKPLKEYWFVFTGTLYAYRDPSLVLEGIKKFIQEKNDKKVKFFFIGERKPPWNSKLPQLVRDLNLIENVAVIDYIPKGEVADYLSSADAFFHIAGDYSVGLSAKIFEYLYAARPICITGKGGRESLKILKWVRGKGKLCKSNSDVYNFIKEVVHGKATGKVALQRLLEFTREKQAEIYLKLFHEVVE